MLRCAKCDDVLEGHTCRACMIRHRCRDPACDCQKFPLLPPAAGHMGDEKPFLQGTQKYAGGNRVWKSTKSRRYRERNSRESDSLRAAGIGTNLRKGLSGKLSLYGGTSFNKVA